MAENNLAGAEQRPVHVWSTAHPSGGTSTDVVAQEVPVALSYNGLSHVVMMASPTQLEDFARGFSLTEGIVASLDDIYAIDVIAQDLGIEVAMEVSNRSLSGLQNRRRNLAGRTGCGLCGAQTLEQVRQDVPTLSGTFTLSHAALEYATLNLTNQQPLQMLAGAVHGAAWCDRSGRITCTREDVGRHNALDKLVGALWRNEGLSQPGFLLMSSRASFEIVQKSAQAGIAVVVALSAPTSLAIDIAEQAGITLVGFSREHRHVTYAHGQRLTAAT